VKWLKQKVLIISIILLCFISIIFVPKLLLFQKQIPKTNLAQITTYENTLENQTTDKENKLSEDTIKQVANKINETPKNSDILGVLIIPKIGLKQEIKEGIDMPTLSEYIGHFPTTSALNGNVGLAAHNRGYKNNYFANIYKLKVGDEITYQSQYGIKKYTVKTSKEISDEDWSYLQKTNDNRLTLITCVKNKPNKRLCVQAIEVSEEKINKNEVKENKNENIENFKNEIFNGGIADNNRVISFPKLCFSTRNK